MGDRSREGKNETGWDPMSFTLILCNRDNINIHATIRFLRFYLFYKFRFLWGFTSNSLKKMFRPRNENSHDSNEGPVISFTYAAKFAPVQLVMFCFLYNLMLNLFVY
jgi:hypothetical protein